MMNALSVITSREGVQSTHAAARSRGFEEVIHTRSLFVKKNAHRQLRHQSSCSRKSHSSVTTPKIGEIFPRGKFNPLFRSTAKRSPSRLPKCTVSAAWGKRDEPTAESADAPPVDPGPPDARNLGRLSKVLPFSVYELQGLKFLRDLKEGDYGADVETLQRALHTFGHMPKDSQITGYFGKATFVAVREWQRSQGLPGTGYWGAMSRETFADVVQRHATAQQALVTRASPTKALASAVSKVVPLPTSSAGKAGIVLGALLLCAGAVAVVSRLREVKGSHGKEVSLTYQGRWGRPESGSEQGVAISDNEGLLNKVGKALYEHFGRFEKAWSGRWRDAKGSEEEEGERPQEYTGVLRYIRNDASISEADEIARLDASIEVLIKELSAVEVQRQAAVKALEEERERSQQLEVQLEYKAQAIAALKSELNSLKASEMSHLTASHRD